MTFFFFEPYFLILFRKTLISIYWYKQVILTETKRVRQSFMSCCCYICCFIILGHSLNYFSDEFLNLFGSTCCVFIFMYVFAGLVTTGGVAWVSLLTVQTWPQCLYQEFPPSESHFNYSIDDECHWNHEPNETWNFCKPAANHLALRQYCRQSAHSLFVPFVFNADLNLWLEESSNTILQINSIYVE